MLRLAVSPPSLPTVGKIAADLGEPLHRVAYAIRSRGIRPSAHAGRLRLYDRAAVARIRQALAAMSGRGSRAELARTVVTKGGRHNGK